MDDTLFYSPKAEFIEEAIAKLKDLGMELEVKDSVAGFLGVHIERDERDYLSVMLGWRRINE